MRDEDGPGADLEAEPGEQAGRDPGVRPAMGMKQCASVAAARRETVKIPPRR
jgi:hypothetical protein